MPEIFVIEISSGSRWEPTVNSHGGVSSFITKSKAIKALQKLRIAEIKKNCRPNGFEIPNRLRFRISRYRRK